MYIKLETYTVITAIEEFLAEHKDHVYTVGYEAYDYIYGMYETLMKMTYKPTNIYLDHEDLKLLGEYL